MSELSVLQQLVARIRAERGFVNEPNKVFMLLAEEIGEIAQELKKTWSVNYGAFSKDRLAEEIADSVVLLVALANEFEIDLDATIGTKFVENDSRRRRRRGDAVASSRSRNEADGCGFVPTLWDAGTSGPISASFVVDDALASPPPLSLISTPIPRRRGHDRLC